MVNRKKCSKCKVATSASYSVWCRRCLRDWRRAYAKRRYTEEPEFRKRVNAATRAWEKRNPEKVAAMRLRNIENHRAACRRYRTSAKGREKDAAYRKAKAAHLKLSKIQWYREHAALTKKRARAWQRANPAKWKAILRTVSVRRRARERNAEGSHTTAEWRALCRRAGHRCAYCGKRKKRLTRDHAKPLCRGGSDFIENIRPACGRCNSRKGTRSAEEFANESHQ
jgi:hypothetical protein